MSESFAHPGHTLTAFDRELAQLLELIERMGMGAAAAVENSLAAIAGADLELAERVIAADGALDQAQLDIEKLVVTMMALRAPKADDLRMLVAALRVAAVLERIGDYAKNVARRAAAVSDSRLASAKPTIAAMGRDAAEMVTRAVRAYLDEDADAARAVVAQDERVDLAWRGLRRELVEEMSSRSRRTAAALDLLLVGQHLERIGDHATNIAEAVYLMVTGERMGPVKLDAAA